MKLAIVVLILGFWYCGSYATANRFVCAQYHGEINPFQPKFSRHDQAQIENSEIAMSEKKESGKTGYKLGGYNVEHGRPGRSSDNYLNQQDKSVYEQGTYNTEASRPRQGPEHELDQQGKLVYIQGRYNTVRPRRGRVPENEFVRDNRVLQGPAGEPIYLSEFAHNDYEF